MNKRSYLINSFNTSAVVDPSDKKEVLYVNKVLSTEICLWSVPVAWSTPISYVYWLSKMQFASVTLRTEKTASGLVWTGAVLFS